MQVQNLKCCHIKLWIIIKETSILRAFNIICILVYCGLYTMTIDVVTWRIIKKWYIWSLHRLHLPNFLCLPVFCVFPYKLCPLTPVWKTGIRISLRDSNFCGLYIKFRGNGKWPWTWWGRQKSQGHRPCRPSHGKWRKACINICKPIEVLKLCIIKSANK